MHLLHSKGRSLRYSPGWGNPLSCVVVLYVEEGVQEGTIPFAFSRFLHYPQANCADSLVDGLVYVLGCCVSLQWTLLWDWEFLPLPQSPQIFTARGFCIFHFLCWNPVFCRLSRSLVVPSSLSLCECGTIQSARHHLACPVLQPLPCHTSSLPPVSNPPTGLGECFFNSLVIGVPCSLIFWHFWLFVVFKLVAILLLVVWGSEAFLHKLPSWLELYTIYFLPILKFLLFLNLILFSISVKIDHFVVQSFVCYFWNRFKFCFREDIVCWKFIQLYVTTVNGSKIFLISEDMGKDYGNLSIFFPVI